MDAAAWGTTALRDKADPRTIPLRGATRCRVEVALADMRAALRAFRALTRAPRRLEQPLDPRSIATCGAEHFAVLAFMHAARGSLHTFAGHALQAIRLEADALGAQGPLRPALVRLLCAFDGFSASAN